MDCVVNDQYRYIMFYGAKVACTSLRNLYLSLHFDSLSQEQQSSLDSYHNLNRVCPFDPSKDYTNYYKFYISRNPYGRAVSAYLDQYAFAQHDGVKTMLADSPPKEGEPQTFLELLRYLKDVPDYMRDSHFQTQSHFGYKIVLPRKPIMRRMHPDQIALNYFGDVSKFNFHLEKVYQRIFKNDPDMRDKAIVDIASIPRMNNLVYGEKTWPNAAELSLQELQSLPFVPKPQDFFSCQESRDLVQEIYSLDFTMFSYNPNVVPEKQASSELKLIPHDFDWQVYALLNPDLEPQGINNERTLTHHYLMHGRLEDKKRFYKLEAPSNFDWLEYIKLNNDLREAGIDNERDALIHYLSFGFHEKRAI